MLNQFDSYCVWGLRLKFETIFENLGAIQDLFDGRDAAKDQVRGLECG